MAHPRQKFSKYPPGYFSESSGKLFENGSHFSQNSPQNCNLGIFRGLKSKSGYFLGFSKNISDEHTYHFYIKSTPPPPWIQYIRVRTVYNVVDMLLLICDQAHMFVLRGKLVSWGRGGGGRGVCLPICSNIHTCIISV